METSLTSHACIHYLKQIVVSDTKHDIQGKRPIKQHETSIYFVHNFRSVTYLLTLLLIASVLDFMAKSNCFSSAPWLLK